MISVQLTPRYMKHLNEDGFGGAVYNHKRKLKQKHMYFINGIKMFKII